MYVLAKESSDTVTSSDLQASTLMTKDYAELIQSRQVTETVIAQLGLDMSHEDLLGKMEVTIATDTRVIKIAVRDPDPYQAAKIADAVREVASEHIKNVMDAGGVNTVEKANIPEAKSSPSIGKNGIIGAFIGALIAIGVILVTFLTNDTIKNSDDVERYLQLSTLGVVPLAEGQVKGKRKSKNGKNRRKK